MKEKVLARQLNLFLTLIQVLSGLFCATLICLHVVCLFSLTELSLFMVNALLFPTSHYETYF